MSVFKTDRQTGLSPAEKLERAIARKQNQKVALENAKYHATLESEQIKSAADLEKIDLENDKEVKKQSALDKLQADKLNKDKGKAASLMETKLYNENKEELFKSTLFEMAFNACWVDDEFKFENIQEMYKLFEEVVQTLDDCGIKKLQEGKFIEGCRSAVYETCRKASARLAKECKDKELTEIDFDLSEDEEEELDNKLSDLGKDEIEELVKKKVLTVIQDEKNIAAKKKSEMDELNQELDNDDDMDDIDDEDEDSDEQPSEAKDTLESIIYKKKLNKLQDISNSTLFEALMILSNRKISNNIITEGIDCSEDHKMNAAMIESIVKYTILETFNTLQMYDFSNISTKKLTKHLITTK